MSTYSSLSNKRAASFINFFEKIQHSQSYSILHNLLLLKILLGFLIFIANKKIVLSFGYWKMDLPNTASWVSPNEVWFSREREMVRGRIWWICLLTPLVPRSKLISVRSKQECSLTIFGPDYSKIRVWAPQYLRKKGRKWF